MTDLEQIQLKGLGKTFPNKSNENTTALKGVDLAIKKNEFVSIVGASGCGKSTLLRIVAGIESASEGEVLFEGNSVTAPARDRAVIFQDYALFPWLNVIENIRASRLFAANTKSETAADVETALARSDALLALMDLERVRNTYPNQLSGGMRQRVAIARALLSKPKALLMDEPFAALDAQTREVMQDLLLHLFRVERSTVMFVTHDVEEAIYLSQRVIVMAPEPGRIDSSYSIDFADVENRTLADKLRPEFLALKAEILDRVRQTSNVQMDWSHIHAISGNT